MPAAPRGGGHDQLSGVRAGYDEATPESVAAFRDLVPGARLAVLARSAHMTMLDEPGASVALLRQFLRDVDRGA